ncbi:MAG: type II toxin-antitoxin system VapC family toxin [Acidobacteriia bacterium]|nr:type II toxin-antitoxin system VapC family toxin [Terriglobia bacterium]
MTTFVVDAGVAAKWLLPASGERLAPEAVSLLRRYTRDEVRFLVPDLFWTELANVLWKAVRQRRCSASDAQSSLHRVLRFGFTTVPCTGLLENALSIALRFDRTAYDSLYVALAVATDSALVTADERLARALAAHFPVRLLGSV